jgi:2-keto-3-deoxy-L-rhamnonate aldolase RhmA
LPQIEDVRFVSEVDAIMRTDGITGLCLGPTDLSGSMGRLGDFYHPEVQAVINPILKAAKERGVSVCTGIVTDVDRLDEWISKGANLPLISIDTTLLVEGASAVIAKSKATVGPRSATA